MLLLLLGERVVELEVEIGSLLECPFRLGRSLLQDDRRGSRDLRHSRGLRWSERKRAFWDLRRFYRRSRPPAEPFSFWQILVVFFSVELLRRPRSRRD